MTMIGRQNFENYNKTWENIAYDLIRKELDIIIVHYVTKFE